MVKNATSMAGTVTASAMTKYTMALPHRTGSRRGTAANVELISPVENSLVIIRTPSTPITMTLRFAPTRLTFSGWNVALSMAVIVPHCATTSMAAASASPIVRPAVTSSV